MSTTEIDKFMEDEKKEEERQAWLDGKLCAELDKKAADPRKHLVIKTHMGVTGIKNGTPIPSYVGTLSMYDLGQDSWFKLGIEMDFMKKAYNAEGKLETTALVVGDIQQRHPDFSRRAALTSYLCRTHHRKFGAIIMVVAPDWIHDPDDKRWDRETGEALETSISYTDISSQIGVINLDKVSVYALDGQHRVLAARGLKDLDADRFFNKTKDGKEGAQIDKTSFLHENNVNDTVIKQIFSEEVPIEFIPAVIKGETAQIAKQRLRAQFVALNQNAKKPEKGETYLLDEDNGYAIVARTNAMEQRLFQSDSKPGNRINFKNVSVPKRSLAISTITHQAEATKFFLRKTEPSLIDNWENKWGYIRPPEEELHNGIKLMKNFYDRVEELPTAKEIMSYTKGEELDNFRRIENDNILARPIGHPILAAAVGRLNERGEELDEIFRRLIEFDNNAGFQQQKPENIWYKVTWNEKNNKPTMITSNQERAIQLLMYMLYGNSHSNGAELSAFVRQERKFEDRSEWIDFDGKNKPWDENDKTSLTLPSPIN